MNVQQRGKAFQLRVIHKQLPRKFIQTFDTKEEAHGYGLLLVASLDRGAVPPEVAARLGIPKRGGVLSTHQVLNRYVTEHKTISKTDIAMVGWIKKQLDDVPFSAVDFDFAVHHAEKLRTTYNLNPETVQKRIGCLGRVWEWYFAKTKEHKLPVPWRQLPAGYSVATPTEQEALLKSGKKVKRKDHRNRRLEEGEEDCIERVFKGENLIETQRALRPSAELQTLYYTIVNTGLRLREAYTLTKEDIDLRKKLIHASGTKGARGAAKPRDVPVRARLAEKLKEWIAQLPADEKRLFPNLWNGKRDDDSLEKATNELSKKFTTIFKHAQLEKFTEHDLRHEATCRWVLLRHEDGRWVYPEMAIVKIMGWSSPKMYERYASLRGQDLVDLLGDL